MAKKIITPNVTPDIPAAVPAKEGRSFEELLAEAEMLAVKMEEGGLSLEDSIRAYEQGMANLRSSAELLKHAEEKVKILLEHNGLFRLEDFAGGDPAPDNDEEED